MSVNITQGMMLILAAALPAGGAQAATLIHDYEFDGASVVDSVGSVDGTLVNGASLSGGKLILDGSNDYVQLAGKIIPTAGADFSVYLKFDATDPQNYGIAEMISQGASGAPGFYLGYYAPGVRVTDNHSDGNGISFPFGAHDMLLTSGGGGTYLYIDGVQKLFYASALTLGSGGDDTRFGTQFASYAEYFTGSIDTVRVFSGVASYAEATTAPGVPEPASWAMMVAGIGLAGAALRRRGVARAA